MELGTYRLISRLGAGGMGEVWRAEDSRLLRQVAIKILPEQLAKDPEWKDRFLREARTVAQLNHPNIATIYSIDQQGDTLFIAMELIEGESVAQVIGRGPVSPADAVRIASKVADGLSEAHEKGIVHRDIKPENIIVSPKLVKVLDFGIAKQIGGTADPALTQGGMVVGTPHYMSPEQALGRSVDARTDIFSLGVVMYEMLTGHKPFTGEAVTEILLHIVMSEPEDVQMRVPATPPALADVIRRCMRKQADDRFRGCDELRDALLATLSREIPRVRTGDIPTIAMNRAEPQRSDSQRSPGFRPAAPPPQSDSGSTTARPASRPSGSAPAAAPQAPKATIPAQPESARYRALVADDDPATRYILTNVLSRNRVAFDEVDNGADAVKQLKVNDYAMIFLDLLMPRIDGWGVIDYLRNRKNRPTPKVFIVTGVTDQKLSSADRDIVSGLVYKPIDIAAIEKIVMA
jgi:serine/threonine protein kinase